MTNETLADIVSEMRRFGQRHWMHDEGQNIRLFADRIEAAWDRERESITPKPAPDWKAICAKCHDGEIEPDCEYYGEPNGCNSPIYGEHPTTGKSSAVGDTAAMREAIKKLLDVMYMLGMDENTVAVAAKGGALPKTSKRLLDAIQSAKAVLAKPPRNCDVGTAEEQAKRMDAYCASHGERIGSGCRCENCPLCSINRCELVWEQMPYEEGGAS